MLIVNTWIFYCFILWSCEISYEPGSPLFLVLHVSDEKLGGSLGMRLVFLITARGHGNDCDLTQVHCIANGFLHYGIVCVMTTSLPNKSTHMQVLPE